MHEELMMDPEKENMQKTAHDKIFIAPPLEVDNNFLHVSINALARAADQNDALVRQELLKAVPTYQPPAFDAEISEERQLLAGA